MPFRFNARYAFLTFPRSEITDESYNEFCTNKGISSALLGRETHADGSNHFHLIADFGRKRNIRDERFFDWNGRHPNVQAVRNIQKSIEYISKENEPVPFGGGIGKRNEDSWHNIIETSSNTEEFIDNMRNNQPRALICSFGSVMSFANYYFKRSHEIYESPYHTFKVELPAMLDFHSRLLAPRRREERIPGIVLRGASQLGKTAWSRSLGRHMYFNGQLNWDRYDQHATYAVLDDIPLEFITKKTQIFGCQREFETSQKYQKVKTIKWGIPVIYLTNDSKYLDKEPAWFKDWWEVNMIEVHLFDRLFE